MASPNSTFTELVTTTLREHPSEIHDNVSNHNAFYRRLKSKGQIEVLDGGLTIVRALDYAENATFQRYSGFDTLNVSASDVFTAAEYSWVQSAVHVVASGRELRINSGSNQIMNLAKARLKNAMRTAANNMSVDLYSSGSLSNQMGGLGAIITSAGTGTVGGIDSATYTFWANQFNEATGTNPISASGGTIISEMLELWLLTERGTDKPDLILATNDFYTAYFNKLQANQRYATDDDAKGATSGFTSLKFITADVVRDNNTNFGATGEKMYFLNTDYLWLSEHRAARWTQSEDKVSVNQDAVVMPILWMGQLTCSNRARQGVLLDAS
jgi:hypothetical protein